MANGAGTVAIHGERSARINANHFLLRLRPFGHVHESGKRTLAQVDHVVLRARLDSARRFPRLSNITPSRERMC